MKKIHSMTPTLSDAINIDDVKKDEKSGQQSFKSIIDNTDVSDFIDFYQTAATFVQPAQEADPTRSLSALNSHDQERFMERIYKKFNAHKNR